MKNPATIFTILFMAVTPSLAALNNATFNNATCITETKSLTTTQVVMSAYAGVQASLENDLKANPFQFCDIVNAQCTINIQPYSANLTSSCEAEGGQVVERDLTATCNGNVMGAPIPNDFTVLVYKAPLCAGESCDPSALPADLETQLETVLKDVVGQVNAAISGSLTCDVSINPVDNGGGTTTSGVQATTIWISITGVALLSSFIM